MTNFELVGKLVISKPDFEEIIIKTLACTNHEAKSIGRRKFCHRVYERVRITPGQSRRDLNGKRGRRKKRKRRKRGRKRRAGLGGLVGEYEKCAAMTMTQYVIVEQRYGWMIGEQHTDSRQSKEWLELNPKDYNFMQ